MSEFVSDVSAPRQYAGGVVMWRAGTDGSPLPTRQGRGAVEPVKRCRFLLSSNVTAAAWEGACCNPVTPPPPQESYSAPPSIALRHHCVSVRSSAAPRVFLYPKTQPKLTVISPTAARSETQRCRRICSKPPPSPLGSSTPLLEGVVPTATRCVVPPSPSRCSAAPALFHRAPPLLFSGSAALHPPLLHSVRSTLRCSKIPLPHILPLLRIVNIKLPPASARHVLAPSPSYSARSKTTEGDGNDAGYYELCILEISALLAFGAALYSCIALCGA
ncbi:hypothetical protein AHAS_Ahas11G0097500 [Arachis hypogaea]